ncbi:unnamed protein product [Rotaria sordida]|uniref:Uncharacterized protein n=1 Tax=Rotaria sordida TaxID=392033 RepID=A0A815B4D4_9BILA|nr:unnamed protein product [Rotaria sordida]
MTSTGQYPEPWKGTAATLFNPYLNINELSNPIRQQSVRTRVLTPTRHSRAPPESLVETGNLKVTTSESVKRPKSKRFPSQNAAEEVSIYVQQMIHNQFCGRSGTPGDLRYDDQQLRRTLNTPNSRITIKKRISSSKQRSRVSEYPLDDFFTTADEQISRMTSMMPGRESSFSENNIPSGDSPMHRSNNGERLTLADMCNVASNVGDKMSQSKEKVGLEAIRGFRLPSARLTYEPYEYHPIEAPILLGQQHIPTDRIRLNDILTDDNYSNAPMIEIVNNDIIDDKSSRISRTHLKSSTTTPSKINEFKDWRGKISQANLPDVRNRLRRQYSASVISPQRPCTAASNFSKSRPESSGGLLINDSQKEEEIPRSSSSNKMVTISVPSVLKNPSNSKQRQRSYPLNVRIDETNVKQNPDRNESDQAQSCESAENRIDPPCLSLKSENTDEILKIREINPHATPVPMLSTSTTPFTIDTNDSHIDENLSSDPLSNKRNYKLISSSSRQIYRTIPEQNQHINKNQTNEQLTQLTLSQLELLENYDPMISAKIGIPFIPVQMLARPRQANQSAKLSIQQIQRNYPKKKGQPVFEPRASRSCHSLIDISQRLQLTKSKRIPIERQTTFEKVENDESIQETIQIKSIENPNRLTISVYSPSEQHLYVKHTNSIRTSSKANPSQSDDISTLINSTDQQANFSHQLKEEQPIEYNLSVLNIRTQQEVDQMRQRGKINQRRLVFPTSIITNSNKNSYRNRHIKQQGRPIPSVFLTQDPDEYNYSTSIYRQARSDVDIKRAFKGFVVENIQRKLSADQRKKREEEQKAAIKIQRAYREHLLRRKQIESRHSSANYPHKKNDSLTKEILFDVVYYIYPPKATGLETSRKSTWIRPIIDGEDETAIQGTPFLEPIDMSLIYKFLDKQ